MLSSSQDGLLFVVSAPSGVGKTTLIRALCESWPELHYSVSCTTRAARAGEVPGKDYHFLSREDFLAGIEAGRFLEWAQVHGEYYGTDGRQVTDWLTAGDDVLLDIDVQGARQVRCAFPRAHTIFILPPSLEILRERLQNRGTETPEQLARRLAAARHEIQEAPWYEYLIVNDVLATAVADLNAVLRACRCQHRYQAPRLRPFFTAAAQPETLPNRQPRDHER